MNSRDQDIVQLKKQLQLQQKVIEASFDALFSMDEEGRFITLSAACKALWGYKPSELHHKSWRELITAPDIPSAIAFLNKVRKSTAGVIFENRCICKDNSTKPVLWSLRWDRQEKVVYGAAKDVSALQQLTYQLKEKDKKLLVTQKMATIGSYEYDLVKQKTTFATDTLYRICGISKKDYPEITSELFLNLVHPKDKRRVKKQLASADTSGSFKTVYRIIKPGGEVAFVSHTSRLTRDSNGFPIYNIGIVQDITQRKRNEEAIRLAEERYHLLFNKAPVPMLIYKVGTWQYVEVNNAAMKQYGYSRAEFLKLNAFDLRPKEEFDRFREILPDLASKNKYKQFRGYKHKKKNGEIIHVDVFTHELELNNEAHILAIVFDITDKIKLQQLVVKEKIAAQKRIAKAIIHAEERERSVLATELHDNVNQILTTTKLYLENIHLYPNAQDVMQKKCTGFLQDAINEIRNISSSLLTPSFYDLGFKPTLIELLEQYRTVQKFEIADTLQLKEHKIDMELKLTCYRIVQEQMNNIVKHARATKVAVTLLHKPHALLLTIQDNGIGFDPSKKTKGLGLDNIKNKASVFKGVVRIESAINKGCKLMVKLPLHS